MHSFAHGVYANPTYSSNIRACSRASRPARSSGALHGLLANCFACTRRRRTHTEQRGRTRSSREQGLRLLGPGGGDSCASTSPLPLAAASHLSAGSCSYRNFLGCADACGMRLAFGHVVAECSLGIASAFPLARFRIPMHVPQRCLRLKNVFVCDLSPFMAYRLWLVDVRDARSDSRGVRTGGV